MRGKEVEGFNRLEEEEGEEDEASWRKEGLNGAGDAPEERGGGEMESDESYGSCGGRRGGMARMHQRGEKRANLERGSSDNADQGESISCRAMMPNTWSSSRPPVGHRG